MYSSAASIKPSKFTGTRAASGKNSTITRATWLNSRAWESAFPSTRCTTGYTCSPFISPSARLYCCTAIFQHPQKTGKQNALHTLMRRAFCVQYIDVGMGELLMERNLPGRGPDAKFVAIGVSELCPFAPGFCIQLLGQSDSTSFERLTCFFDIVSMQDVASEASFVTATLAAQPEHEMGLCSRRSHFEPAFSFAHGLIIDLFKAKCVDIEVEGFVLVTDSYADGAEFCEHTYLLCVDHQ